MTEKWIFGHSIVSKGECESRGMEFVKPYRKHNGERIRGYCRPKHNTGNPAVNEIKRNFREREEEIRADKELRKYGTEIPGGYTLSGNQLKEYFKSKERK